MPTFIGHAVTGIALSSIIFRKRQWLGIGIMSIFCSIGPDIDAIGFKLGIPYQHWLGHRGFSHSIIFAIALGLMAFLFVHTKRIQNSWLLFGVLLSCGLVHDVLDAMTSGGLGVAFFSPLSETRYFLPWRPIEVSPLILRRFLSHRGVGVMKSEFVWVMVPSLCFMVLTIWYRMGRRRRKTKRRLRNSILISG
ncbi:MAG: metal-dependent hydrolase [Thermodesulfobacteriota bacterium]